MYTEQLYQALHHGAQQTTTLSMHLTDFPQAEDKVISTALEKKMRKAQKIVSLTSGYLQLVNRSK